MSTVFCRGYILQVVNCIVALVAVLVVDLGMLRTWWQAQKRKLPLIDAQAHTGALTPIVFLYRSTRLFGHTQQISVQFFVLLILPCELTILPWTSLPDLGSIMGRHSSPGNFHLLHRGQTYTHSHLPANSCGIGSELFWYGSDNASAASLMDENLVQLHDPKDLIITGIADLDPGLPLEGLVA